MGAESSSVPPRARSCPTCGTMTQHLCTAASFRHCLFCWHGQHQCFSVHNLESENIFTVRFRLQIKKSEELHSPFLLTYIIRHAYSMRDREPFQFLYSLSSNVCVHMDTHTCSDRNTDLQTEREKKTTESGKAALTSCKIFS